MQLTKTNLHTLGLLASLTALFVLAQFAQVLVSKLQVAVKRDGLALTDAEFVRDASAQYFMPYLGMEVVSHSGNTFGVKSSVGPRPRAVEANWKDSARFYDESGAEIARTQPCHAEYTTVENIRAVLKDDCRTHDGEGWFQYQHWSKLLPPKATPTESIWEYRQVLIPERAKYIEVCTHIRIQVHLLMGDILTKSQSLCTPKYNMETGK